jgi:hypothetical protein
MLETDATGLNLLNCDNFALVVLGRGQTEAASPEKTEGGFFVC